MLCAVSAARAQDVHFSQYYAMPIFHNPAFTGYFDGDVRVAADFRMQWETFGQGFGNAFSTGAFAADFGFLKNRTTGSTLGVGLTFINDRAGDLNLMTNQVGLALNYVQALGSGSNYLAAGFHGTFSQRSIDLTDAVFPDQVETDIIDNHTYFNFGAGLLWFFQPNSTVNMYFGGAMHNIIRPNVSFFDGVDEELDRRISAQFGSSFEVSDNVSLVPSLMFQKQGPSQEFILGSFFKYRFGGYGPTADDLSLQLGAFYRFTDAIIPVVRFDVKDVSIIASYDVNLSKLTSASRGEGGAEISITWTGAIWTSRSKAKPIRCPIL